MKENGERQGLSESLAPKIFINDQDICYSEAGVIYSVSAMQNYKNI